MATTPDIAFERGLPASIDAERSILGAILLENTAYNEAAERITADDFALDSHQRLFARMGELINSGRPVDIVTLTDELGRRKEVDSVGGVCLHFLAHRGLATAAALDRGIRPHRQRSLAAAAADQALGALDQRGT